MVIPLWNRNRGNIRAAQADVGASVAGSVGSETSWPTGSATALGQYLTARQLVERYETTDLAQCRRTARHLGQAVPGGAD